MNVVTHLFTHQYNPEFLFDFLKESFPNSYVHKMPMPEGYNEMYKLQEDYRSMFISWQKRTSAHSVLPQQPECYLTESLLELRNAIKKNPAKNIAVRNFLLRKIETINMRIAVQTDGFTDSEINQFTVALANRLDAIFVIPEDDELRAEGTIYLDKNRNLILDHEGNCEIDDLSIEIEREFYGYSYQTIPDQIERKKRNLKRVIGEGIHAIDHLPCKPSEQETRLKTPKEVAQRASVVAFLLLVAFDHAPLEIVVSELKRFHLWEHLTEEELAFIANPTEQSRSRKTWLCEVLWTLMWVMNEVEDLGPADKMCRLDNIASSRYPVGPETDTTAFINSVNSLRSKKEILDMTDLYYRYHWACVDERIRPKGLTALNEGIVYEKRYALEWVIQPDVDWEDIELHT